jgi:hypothetical protein
MTQRLTWLRGLHQMRDGVLERLDDVDLAFTPGGANPSFGHLLEEVAALEESYAGSLDGDVQEWPSTDLPRDGTHSTSRLHERFQTLDAQLESAVSELSDGAIRDVTVTRPDGTVRTPDEQVEIYTQAMFIFLGKAVVYLRAMGRALPPSVERYIG